MKFCVKHFKFKIKSRRFQKKIWEKYYKVKKETKKLNEQDKYFLKQFRDVNKLIEYEVTITHIPSNKSITTIVKDKINRKNLIKKLLESLKKCRLESRKLSIQNKIFEGAPYCVVGGVMEKANLINEIAKHTTINDPFISKAPRHRHKNYIGIELEFLHKTGVSNKDIAKALTDAGLGRYTNVTTDPSCGWEVRVLLPEDDYIDPLKRIMKILKDDLGHTVNHKCGAHVHFDMRNRDVKLVYENLFKTQKFLRKFLTRQRKKNRYCQMNKEETFDKQFALYDRYYSINVQSYNKHQTLEVRMYQGTLDSDELIPWIGLLLKIVNYNQNMTKKVNTLKQATKQFSIDETLVKHLEQRILLSFRSSIPSSQEVQGIISQLDQLINADQLANNSNTILTNNIGAQQGSVTEAISYLGQFPREY